MILASASVDCRLIAVQLDDVWSHPIIVMSIFRSTDLRLTLAWPQPELAQAELGVRLCWGRYIPDPFTEPVGL